MILKFTHFTGIYYYRSNFLKTFILILLLEFENEISWFVFKYPD